MGSQRSQSERRRATRLSLGPSDRPTLLPCPACTGTGRHTIEIPGGRYKGKDCVWCGASGSIDHFVMRLWVRWLKLRNVNRECVKKNP